MPAAVLPRPDCGTARLRGKGWGEGNLARLRRARKLPYIDFAGDFSLLRILRMLRCLRYASVKHKDQ